MLPTACAVIARPARHERAGGLLLAPGQSLYCNGNAFHTLYTVHSGALRAVVSLADGRDQVCAFHLPGEVVGLDGIGEGRHTVTVTALEDTELVAVAYGSPTLQWQLNQLMSHEIVRGKRMLLLLGSLSASERLATFLLDLAPRARVHGQRAGEFVLCMTRADIGSYLGLSLETVSRTFSSLQREHWLQVHKRQVRINHLDGFAPPSTLPGLGKTPPPHPAPAFQRPRAPRVVGAARLADAVHLVHGLERASTR